MMNISAKSAPGLYRKAYGLCFLLACCFLASALTFSTAAIADDEQKNEKLTPVRVQLKWFHQFQFAGFYAAREKGYFQEAGLEVELIEGGPSIDPTQVVESGGAEFGVGNSTLIIDFNKGRPVVAVSAIFQRSPFVILARRDKGIVSVKDLQGRTLMGEIHAAELIAYLKLSGVDLTQINRVPHTGNIASLSSGQPGGIDAATAYVSVEPYDATGLNIPYQIFNPRDLDIDFYGDTLFTSRQFAVLHPDVVKKMRDALKRGWEYARLHPDEVIDIILSKYHVKRDRLALSFESQATLNLLGDGIVEIGYMSSSRWRHIGDVFVEAGELQPDYSMDGFLFEIDDGLPLWVYQVLAASFVLLILGLLVTLYIVRLNRKLSLSLLDVSRKTRELEVVNEKLQGLSNTDWLTGLSNRRHFDHCFTEEFKRARRNNTEISILLIDVDSFKSFNDHYGHPAGDACLVKIAQALSGFARRAGDLVARYGGEEFCLMFPSMNKTEAQHVAKKAVDQIAALSLPHEKSEYSFVTISVGVYSAVPKKGLRIEDYISHADAALYAAKNAGKNGVCVY